MAYTHGASRARIEALHARQQAAADEALRAEAELDAILKAEHDLVRTQRRRDKALAELLKVRDKFQSEAEAAESDLEAMRQARLDIATNARKAVTATNKLNRELTRAEEAEIDLHRLQRERARISAKLQDKNAVAITTIHRLTRPTVELPPPVHGGRDGLEAAVREASEHERRERSDAA